MFVENVLDFFLLRRSRTECQWRPAGARALLLVDCYKHFAPSGAKNASSSARIPNIVRRYAVVFLACDCTAVMATASTMSSALHPRDKSLHGRSNP